MQAWTPLQSIRQVNRSHTKLSLQISRSSSTRPSNGVLVRRHGVGPAQPLIRLLDSRPLINRRPQTDVNGNADADQPWRVRYSDRESHVLPAVDAVEEEKEIKDMAKQDNSYSRVDSTPIAGGIELPKIRQVSYDRAFARAENLKKYLLRTRQDTPFTRRSVTSLVEDQKEEDKQDDTKDIFLAPSKDLPRPPFMQADMHRGRGRRLIDPVSEGNESNPFRNASAVANDFKMERSQSVEGQRPLKVPRNVFHLAQKRSLTVNLKEAPFSTMLHHNPYAHALAAPVREDCFSGAHLPNSCLLDFHIVDPGLSPEDISLLPLSLAAEVVSKKKTKKITPEEGMARLAQQDNSSFAPQGAGSYMLGTKAAVEFVTDDPQKRVRSMVASRRINIELNNQQHSKPLKWREDMPDFILDGLRKAVVKKLSWLFRAKGSKNRSGMLFEIIPGFDRMDLSRINDADDPACVLQLTMPSGPGPYDSMAERNDVATSAVDPADGTHPQDLHLEQTTAEAAEDLLETSQEIDENDDIAEEEPIADKSSMTELLKPIRPVKKESRQVGWWVTSTNKTLHAGTKPLPPPFRPLLTKYPTLLFRNRAIPIYNLPQLLGEELTAKLVKGTVFNNSKYVALGTGQGTVPPQVWLLRLQIYLAEDRSYKAMRRERKWTREWMEEAEAWEGDDDGMVESEDMDEEE